MRCCHRCTTHHSVRTCVVVIYACTALVGLIHDSWPDISARRRYLRLELKWSTCSPWSEGTHVSCIAPAYNLVILLYGNLDLFTVLESLNHSGSVFTTDKCRGEWSSVRAHVYKCICLWIAVIDDYSENTVWLSAVIYTWKAACVINLCHKWERITTVICSATLYKRNTCLASIVTSIKACLLIVIICTIAGVIHNEFALACELTLHGYWSRVWITNLHIAPL